MKLLEVWLPVTERWAGASAFISRSPITGVRIKGNLLVPLHQIRGSTDYIALVPDLHKRVAKQNSAENTFLEKTNFFLSILANNQHYSGKLGISLSLHSGRNSVWRRHLKILE